MIKKPALFGVIVLITLCIHESGASAQLGERKATYNHQDSLRGMNGPSRQKWDVLHYEISVKPDYVSKTIQG
ncbi:MAG TPA: hypothetical protein VK498_01825, partial [Ferruginibacter sp.]|nr:hypothetical protein [Ferruginibacter sp.]